MCGAHICKFFLSSNISFLDQTEIQDMKFFSNISYYDIIFSLALQWNTDADVWALTLRCETHLQVSIFVSQLPGIFDIAVVKTMQWAKIPM